MKYTPFILLALLSLMLFSACDDEAPSNFEEKIVVDGFMWVGQRMQISLTHTVRTTEPYYDDSVKVTGATVTVSVDGVVYPLTEAESGVPGTYAAETTAPIVTTGERYELLVVSDGDTLSAQTTAAADIELTQTVLVDVNNNIPDPNPDTLEYGGDELRLSWTTSDANFGYAILSESLEDSKYGESCDFGDDNGPGTYLAIWSTRYIGSQDIPWIGLCYTGQTQFRVFSCDTAWWNSVSTTLVGDFSNDPLSNIENGKGVFCAIDCDTFQIMVTDTLED